MSKAALAIRIMVLAPMVITDANWWTVSQEKFGGKTADDLIREERLSEVYEELLAMWKMRAE